MTLVPDDLDGERLDRIVAIVAGISRSRGRLLVEGGGVLVAGEVGSARDRIRAGVELTIPDVEADPGLEPEDVPFVVHHEDDDVLVVEKPAGVVTHPGSGNRSGTLAAGLLYRYPEIHGVGQADRWGLVHRLDRDTSGLLVVARSKTAYPRLITAMKRRQISRRYTALVAGRFDLPMGTIEAPIMRDPRHPTRMRVHSEGRDAVTHYEEIRPVGDDTLIEVTLETGRTHQVRVHMAAIDHPVIGDRVYGPGSSVRGLDRLFLHANRLGFDHPISGEPMVIESPLPPELVDLL